MLIPIKWLKDYVEIDISIKELSEKLVSCGFEIEEVIDLSKDIVNVVVGRIESIEKHPNADKLQVCQLNIGKKTLQILTAAKNVSVGDYVPVALDNSSLPCGKKIFSGEIRGLMSEGMLVGGSEFNYTDADYPNASVDGILILEKGLTLGQDINEVFGTDEVVLDVGITANRIDANSIYGIAREVAAVTGKPLKPLNLDYKVQKAKNAADLIEVQNLNNELCPRYMASVVEDICIKNSPKIIKNRLKAVGIRSINNIVDITNYVLIEIGQPMHAFDINTINGNKIVVRNANEGEKILALDGKEYALKPSNLVIANQNEAMAVAGIMGGENYSVSNNTNTIVFESARFKRDNVRRSAKELNLHSDSSARFGKGVDFYCQETGMKRALALIDEYKLGNIVDGFVDNFLNKPTDTVIRFSQKEIENILGIKIAEDEILRILNALTLNTVKNGNEFVATIPAYREDITIVNDIAEELIRIYGYKHITPTLIKDGTMVQGGKTKAQKNLDKIKDILVGKGAYEILTYSFTSPKIFDYLKLPIDDELRNVIKLINPLGEDFSVMRPTLAHSMIKAISTNYQRGNKELLFFEVAKTYKPNGDLTNYPVEKNMLALGAMSLDFYAFKAIISDLLSVLRINARFNVATMPYLQKGRTATISMEDGQKIGYFGEVDKGVLKEYDVDQRVYLAELDVDLLTEKALTMLPFKTVSKYQIVERDLALIAKKEVEADAILDSVKNSVKDILKSVSIFDVYEGGQIEASFKSVAIKMIFQSDERTLKDTDINQNIDIILKDLEKINVKLR